MLAIFLQADCSSSALSKLLYEVSIEPDVST